MARRFLVLIGVIAVVMAALFVSTYILDWVKAPELWQDLRKIFSLLGVATVAGLVILLLVKIGEKK
jgi:cytochrome bd-type quinol oxidase subunit 2